MHALIIEDDFLISDLIQDTLRDLGYVTFDLAYGEQQAIEYAGVRCPDLITADGRLMDGSGVGAVQSICEHRAIPVVFITGDESNITRVIPEAVIVEKPFRTAALQEAVGVALTRQFRSKPAEREAT